MVAICEDDPRPPSARTSEALEVWADDRPSLITPDELARRRGTDLPTLRRQLRGDLDSIVMKALAKDPAARYRSMEQLSDDLGRHLESRPVMARQTGSTSASRLYQSGKFLRRHRERLAASALVLALLIAGAGTWWRARERVRASAEQAAAAESQAEALTLFARNLMRAADPDKSGGRALTARQILEQGHQEARRRLSGNPELLAHQLDAIGRSYQDLGELTAARPLLEEALRRRRDVYGEDHRLVARGLNNLAAVVHQMGERSEAEELYRAALAMKRRLRRPEAELRRIEGNLATLLAFRGEYDEAELVYRAILDERRRSYGAGSRKLVMSLRNLGSLYYLKGDFDAAESLLREALGPLADERTTLRALVLIALGRVEHARGRLEEAEALLAEGAAIRRELLGPGHLHTALAERDLAHVFFDLGEDAVAEVLWGRAQQVIRAKGSSPSWELADAESRLGVRLAARGRRAEAEVCLRESYETLRRRRGEASLFARQARERLELATP